MPELREGLILTVDQVKNGSFTFKGKEVKLEQDKNNPLVFTGQTKLTEDQVKAGNLNVGFTYNAGIATGTVNSYTVIPDTDDFKDLNDAEKVTKLNSIEYQFGTEPTDTGNQLDHVLQNSVDTTPSQDKPAKLQQQQKEKEKEQQKESSVTTLKQPTESNNNRETVKSGDNVKVSKEKQF